MSVHYKILWALSYGIPSLIEMSNQLVGMHRLLNHINMYVYIIATFFPTRLWESYIKTHHLQLCIAIFFMLLFFLVGINRTENNGVCTLFSLLIYYFVMESLLWMTAEALFFFRKLYLLFPRITNKYIITVSILCWGETAITTFAVYTCMIEGHHNIITCNFMDTRMI